MRKRRVVKVGGSLLASRQLGAKLSAWLAENNDMQNVVLVGGGVIVDVLREYHDAHGLTERQSHELACEAMSMTAKVVACSITVEVVDEFSLLGALNVKNVIFDASAWILGQSNVPASWDFTSDSIAARLASEIGADELVLLKSRIGSIDEPGFVDACFQSESQSVKSIRVCTLIE